MWKNVTTQFTTQFEAMGSTEQFHSTNTFLPFYHSLDNPRKVFEKCVSNRLEAVLLQVLPFLQPIANVTTVRPQRIRAPITSDSSLTTRIFPNLSCCPNPSPRVKKQLIVTSLAFTFQVVASPELGKQVILRYQLRADTSISIATRLLKRRHVPLESSKFRSIKARWVSTIHRLCHQRVKLHRLPRRVHQFKTLINSKQRPKKTIFQSGNYPNTTATLFWGKIDSVSLAVS